MLSVREMLEQRSLVAYMWSAGSTYDIAGVCRKAESLRRHHTSEANQTGEEEAIIHLPIKKLPDSSTTSGEFQPCVAHYAKLCEASEGCLVLPLTYAPVW